MKRSSAWHASRLYGTLFTAEWRITQDGDTVEHPETRGTVPAEFTFEGDTLEGTVKGSNRSRSSTQGKGGTLTMYTKPWVFCWDMGKASFIGERQQVTL